MTGEIVNLIDELPQASNKRVKEIAAILEGVLADIECKYPIEDDSESAYECENIPKAKELIVLVRDWNDRGRESGIKTINELSKDLKTTFNQI